jgi:hypothetical protein
MATRLRGHFEDFELRSRHELRPEEAVRSFSDARFALRFLSGLAGDPFAMSALRQVAARGLQAASLRERNDREVLEQLARDLSSGRLYLVPLERFEGYLPPTSAASSSAAGETHPDTRASSGDSGRGPNRRPRAAPMAGAGAAAEPISPEAAFPPPPIVNSWVTFKLILEDTGEPASGVDLRLKGPDGTVSTYTTDAAGTVHLSDLPPGTCDLERVLDIDALEVVHFE